MQKRRIELTTLGIGFLSFIVIGMPNGLLGVAWPSMSQTFHLPLEEVGKLLLISTLSYTLASFVCGQLITRFGMGKFFLASSLINGIGLAALSIAPTWWLFIVMNIATGFGTGAMDTGMNIYLAGRYKASVINWLHACFGLGATLGPILITTLLQNGQSWRLGYLALAVAQALMILAVWITLPLWDKNGNQQKPSPGDGAKSHISLGSTLMLPTVWLSMAVFFMYTGVEVTAGQWAYSLFTLGRSIEPATAGFWTSVYWGCFTFGRMVLGFFVDRFGVGRVLTACMLAAIAGSALLWLNPAPLVSFLGLGLVGLAFAPIFPTLVSNTPRLIGKDHAPNTIGLEVGTASLGYAALPGLAGILAARINLEIIGPYLVVGISVMLLLFQVLIHRKHVGVKSAALVADKAQDAL